MPTRSADADPVASEVRGGAPAGRTAPVPVRFGRKARAHQLVAFEDPVEDRTWVFDVTFLLSSWRCIFGAGCQGVLTAPTPELVQGCCSYGAHFVDEDDRRATEAMAKRLRPDQWQHHGAVKGRPTRIDGDGALVTRLVDDACIFLNRPDFPGGPGCALHRAALDAGERPLDWKPDVCWQLPLRREDATDDRGHVTSTVRQWDRRHWGEGGDEFAWWCTDDPEAFVDGERAAGPGDAGPRVVDTMAAELIELTSVHAYEMVAAHCAATAAGSLPHPATLPA